MKLVSCRCPSCGAKIDMDIDKKTTVCEFCKSKILVDDEIKKYEVKGNIEIKNIPKLENYINLGNRYYEDEEYKEAYEQYNKVCELDPDNYIAVLRRGLCKALCTNYLNFEINGAINGIKNANKIIKKQNLDKLIINDMIVECHSVIQKLEMFANNFYKKNNLDFDEVGKYIERLELCLDAYEYINTLVLDNLDLKIKVINSIIDNIDNILKNKKYITGNYTSSGTPLKSNYKFNLSYKSQLMQKKNKYIIERNKLDPEIPLKELKLKKEKSKKISNIFCYIAVAFSGIFMLSSLSNSLLLTSFLWLISIFLFIPKIKKILVSKNKNFSIIIILLRIIIFITAFIMFGVQIPSEYEKVWVSDKNDKLIIKDKNISIQTVDGKKEKGSYVASSDENLKKYIIKATINKKIYYYKYEEINYNKRSFCKLENDKCTIYFHPEDETTYEYIKN